LDNKIIKKLISYVVPISLGSVVAALAGVIDVITVVDGLQKKGYSLQVANEKFGIILGKVDILNAVPMSINVAFSVALVPFIASAMARHRKDEAIDKINFSLKVSSLIALPCTFGLFLLARPIFELIFPNAPEGYQLLMIQCWQLIFAVIAQTVYGSLQGLGKLYVPGFCLILGAIAKYVMNVTLIPIYGEVIPVISSVMYNVISCSIAFIALFKTLKKKPNIKEIFIKPLIATVAMSIVVLIVYNGLSYLNFSGNMNTIITIVIAVIAYGVFVLKFRVLRDHELQQLPCGDKISRIFGKQKKK